MSFSLLKRVYTSLYYKCKFTKNQVFLQMGHKAVPF